MVILYACQACPPEFLKFCKHNYATSPHISTECLECPAVRLTQRHTHMAHMTYYGSARASLKHLETLEFCRHSSKQLNRNKQLKLLKNLKGQLAFEFTKI